VRRGRLIASCRDEARADAYISPPGPRIAIRPLKRNYRQERIPQSRWKHRTISRAGRWGPDPRRGAAHRIRRVSSGADDPDANDRSACLDGSGTRRLCVRAPHRGTRRQAAILTVGAIRPASPRPPAIAPRILKPAPCSAGPAGTVGPSRDHSARLHRLVNLGRCGMRIRPALRPRQ